MFASAALIDEETFASRPGLSSVRTDILTAWAPGWKSPQATSTSRSLSNVSSPTLGQSAVWIDTPLPRVMNPTTLSPGTGLQHLDRWMSMLSIPLIFMLLPDGFACFWGGFLGMGSIWGRSGAILFATMCADTLP